MFLGVFEILVAAIVDPFAHDGSGNQPIEPAQEHSHKSPSQGHSHNANKTSEESWNRHLTSRFSSVSRVEISDGRNKSSEIPAISSASFHASSRRYSSPS